MNWKKMVWKYTTVLVVVLIILNPETVELALVIDAIGLDMFLMLLEIQVAAIFSTKIKPILADIKCLWAKHFMGYSWNYIMKEPESLMLVVPSPSTVMHVLVFSAAIGVVLTTFY